ncbi:conserved hypothetical protein [Desulfamplus magnetovallimortis]|uniref:Uncharacterized protein n=1 Tax=Desulfamplus magnetovallimortis TaxID=1246637 RepID=A0A1W1HJJ0_9BACT|nr:conserved hypothetical protein [Desulfamplus magnetovallimortis]
MGHKWILPLQFHRKSLKKQCRDTFNKHRGKNTTRNDKNIHLRHYKKEKKFCKGWE